MHSSFGPFNFTRTGFARLVKCWGLEEGLADGDIISLLQKSSILEAYLITYIKKNDPRSTGSWVIQSFYVGHYFPKTLQHVLHTSANLFSINSWGTSSSSQRSPWRILTFCALIVLVVPPYSTTRNIKPLNSAQTTHVQR